MAQELNTSALAARLELTCLRPDLTLEQLAARCRFARSRRLRALYVPGCRIAQARHLLEDAPVKLVSPAGFPFGHSESDVKRFETECAIDSGADEIELVLNYGWIKDSQLDRVQREIRDVIEAASDHPVRLLLDCFLLEPDQVRSVLRLPTPREIQGIKCVKGLGTTLPGLSDLSQFLESMQPDWPLIVDGPLDELAQAVSLLDRGAACLSTSSGDDLMDKLLGPPAHP
jgi:deoxyribose-phosphate aldolase